MNNVLIFARSHINQIFNIFIIIQRIISTSFNYLFKKIKNVQNKLKHIDETRKKLFYDFFKNFSKIVIKMQFHYKNRDEILNSF